MTHIKKFSAFAILGVAALTTSNTMINYLDGTPEASLTSNYTASDVSNCVPTINEFVDSNINPSESAKKNNDEAKNVRVCQNILVRYFKGDNPSGITDSDLKSDIVENIVEIREKYQDLTKKKYSLK